MREYELMYIVRPSVGEDGLTSATERVDSFITGLGGELTDKQLWGKRRLAYPLQKYDDGYYVVQRFKADPQRTRELEEQLRISDDVLRHILVHAAELPQMRQRGPGPSPDAGRDAAEAEAQSAPEAEAEAGEPEEVVEEEEAASPEA